MAGRPRKTLEELVRDGTFRARKHRHRLAEPDVGWPELAELQTRYRDAEDEFERRQVAVEFEKLAADVDKLGGLTMRQHLYAEHGPEEPELLDLDTRESRPATALGRRWKKWDQEHGPVWRAQHGIAGDLDLVRLAELAGARTRRPEKIRAQLPRLLRKFAPAPDPPGWRNVS